jgi:hypothetical protein
MYQYPQYPQYSGYQPQQTYQPQQFQTVAQVAGMPQTQGIIKVTGMEGAKAYQMPPNSEMPLFDSGGDVLYIKTTDGAGFPTITIADCVKRGQAQQSEGYVTREDFDRAYADLSRQIEQAKEVFYGSIPTTPAGQSDSVKASRSAADDRRRSQGNVRASDGK